MFLVKKLKQLKDPNTACIVALTASCLQEMYDCCQMFTWIWATGFDVYWLIQHYLVKGHLLNVVNVVNINKIQEICHRFHIYSFNFSTRVGSSETESTQIKTGPPSPQNVCQNLSQQVPFKQTHMCMCNYPPLSLSVLPTALCGVAITVAGGVIKGFPQKLLRLWGWPWVINRCHVSPCQPLFIALWLEFLHKDIHGNLYHVFTARALKRKKGTWQKSQVILLHVHL